MQALTTDKNPTHIATLNGATLRFHNEDYDTAMPAFVEKYGPGVPDVKPLETLALVTFTNDGNDGRMVVRPGQMAVTNKLGVGDYDAAGDARSAADRAAAKLAGFSPRQPVYRQGLRATGMQKYREKFERMPFAVDACSHLVVRVAAEERRDIEWPAKDVRLNKEGLLALGRSPRLAFNERGFKSLVARLGMPQGASTYLPAIDATDRAVNVNNWAVKNITEGNVVVRTRNVLNENEPDAVESRECFGVVSDSYGQFDADQIAAAVRLACPEDARARVAYDGQRTKIDVVFFSNIIPDHAVAGEFFQAAVQVRTDDTGGGSIVVSAALHQNLCLNFIILDKAVEAVARIRHVGSTEALAEKFREAFKVALTKIEHFTKAWGYAQEDDVAAASLVVAKNTGEITAEEFDGYVVRPISEVLPGIFNGLLERDLVPLPKRDRAATVKALMTMWEKDESAARRDATLLTRASVVNAVTRYAHEVNEDPFTETEIESAGGALLFGKAGKAPAPLPFVPLPV